MVFSIYLIQKANYKKYFVEQACQTCKMSTNLFCPPICVWLRGSNMQNMLALVIAVYVVIQSKKHTVNPAKIDSTREKIAALNRLPCFSKFILTKPFFV